MNRHDDDDPRAGDRDEPRHAPDPRRDPYEARRNVRSFGDDDAYAAGHPWQAAHPDRDRERGQRPRWSEQPARYGGAYRDDEDELWSHPRATRGESRHGSGRPPIEGYQNPDNRHRAHGYGHPEQAWQGAREYGRNAPGQSNSGYDAERAYGQGNQHDDARDDFARASYTQEHDYRGPRYGAPHWAHTPGRGDYGMQAGQPDTYGSAGFRQQGKRYWFDVGDERGQFRGTRPRGYERSDERLRELICERLTDADIDATDIEVKVAQGTVTLEGSVRARWMKHQAEDLIDDLGGVKDIHNQLRVTARGEAAGSAAGTPAAGGASSGTPGGSTSSAASSTGGATGSGQGGGDPGSRSRH
jgi:BON domain